MTARPIRAADPTPRLRVVAGKRTDLRLHISPWMMVLLIGVVGMFAMVVGRTTLDRGAVELSQLDVRLAAAEARAAELELEIADLESATRIGPLAEEMGMIYPTDRMVLVVDGPVKPAPPDSDVRLAMEP